MIASILVTICSDSLYYVNLGIYASEVFMAISFYSLGAAEEVTGSKHVLEINGKPLLIDCGAFQGTRAEADRKNREFDFAAEKLETKVYDTRIRECTAIKEAQALRKDIFLYAPKSNAADDYNKLTDEIINNDQGR